MSHAHAIRSVYPSVLGKLLAFTRSLPDAEDAVHDAVERALLAWQKGMPESPEAWLITVAQNAHRDRLRKLQKLQSHGSALEVLAQLSPCARIAPAQAGRLRGFADPLLGLLFACCHPELEEGESAALALATVVGLSTDEIARAFLVERRAMEQRLTRARQRLRERGDGEGASPEQGRARLPAVLRAVHLLFNEGYWSSDDASPIRAELCGLALGLAHSLAQAFPDEPEGAGLLALLLLHEARRAARLDAQGNPLALPDQDRSRWDHAAIQQVVESLQRTLARGAPGPLQLEAAIAAVHCQAASASDTDWGEVASLYALLEGLRPQPAVRVNRAFALGKASGADAGLALLERTDIAAASYPYVHLVRGALLAEAGQTEAAIRALREALRHARNAHERRQIAERLDQLERVGP